MNSDPNHDNKVEELYRYNAIPYVNTPIMNHHLINYFNNISQPQINLNHLKYYNIMNGRNNVSYYNYKRIQVILAKS